MLGAGLALTSLGGCGLFSHDPDPPTPVDALQPVLDEALALAIAYDRAILSLPAVADRLSPLAADHRAHAAELVTLIGRTSPTSAAASGPALTTPSAGASADEVIAGFRTAEQSALKTAVAACKATTAVRAGSVGSIAACRATHVEALR
ncbi:hypothetical protein Ato02nite_012720 [Paractinoplanes toevensis]|uniref:Uncharacterized protein n=1 Tax=Paractinoplanes toevensis TaxID=571911 RepID=A0A919W0P7_9ACTN|nr:hypothetical protein Ato02nite_012720 [Actinoplanes toevensis]